MNQFAMLLSTVYLLILVYLAVRLVRVERSQKDMNRELIALTRRQSLDNLERVREDLGATLPHNFGRPPKESK